MFAGCLRYFPRTTVTTTVGLVGVGVATAGAIPSPCTNSPHYLLLDRLYRSFNTHCLIFIISMMKSNHTHNNTY